MEAMELIMRARRRIERSKASFEIRDVKFSYLGKAAVGAVVAGIMTIVVSGIYLRGG
jgi:hypothetical protein